MISRLSFLKGEGRVRVSDVSTSVEPLTLILSSAPPGRDPGGEAKSQVVTPTMCEFICRVQDHR